MLEAIQGKEGSNTLPVISLSIHVKSDQHIPTSNPTASAKQCFCGLLLPQNARPIHQPDPKWKLGEQVSQQVR